MKYEYYDDAGQYVSRHSTTSVPLRKGGGFVVDPRNYEVILESNVIVVRSKPGTWVSVDTDGSLSHSAYRRCGPGTRWRAYWRKDESACSENSIDGTSVDELIPIPLVRANKTFRKQIKIPAGVRIFYLSAGKSPAFSSLIVRSVEDASDLVTIKYCLNQLKPDRIIRDDRVVWFPGYDRFFG